VLRTIYWEDGRVMMLDQRKLPWSETYVECRNYRQVADAIRRMVIRGAPAIGIAAAMGVALGAAGNRARTRKAFFRRLDGMCAVLESSRPTAVNLSWAVARMKATAQRHADEPLDRIRRALLDEALLILKEDVEANRRIGKHGASLVPDGAAILTHCNAGALATGGYGTALGVVRAAVEAGKRVSVFADETRPFLQGARLTAWELLHDGIPVTVITDGMAGALMSRNTVDAVVVGADRIAANGDTANKVGTYPLAVLAARHRIPFYVAAPLSTVDLSLPSGEGIPIEERPAAEVTEVFGKRVTPAGTPVRNIAFDVTPHELITAVITECGVARAPFRNAFAAMMREGSPARGGIEA